jgi:hypothetical protein
VKTVTLKGDNIASDFQRIVERYVQERYAQVPDIAKSIAREPTLTTG